MTGVDLHYLDTSKVTSMKRMFGHCSNLISADISGFKTSKVTSMHGMFEYCYRLNSVDVSRFNTSNVTNMGRMFYRCKNLTEVDVSNFDTSNVTDMEYMFYCCSHLKEVDVSGFRTDLMVVGASGMFAFCHSLETLDLRNFHTYTIYTTDMFLNCNSLKTITIHRNLLLDAAESLIETLPVLINAETGDTYTTVAQIRELQGTVTLVADEQACDKVRGWYFDENDYLHITGRYERYNNPQYMYEDRFDTARIKGIIGEKGSVLVNAKGMCSGYENLEKVDLSETDMSSVTSMYQMFMLRDNLVEINLGTFDAAKVDNFSECLSYDYNLMKITADGALLSKLAKQLENISLTWEDADTGTQYDISALRSLTGNITLIRPMKGDGWYIDDDRCLHITGAVHNIGTDGDGYVSTPWNRVRRIFTSVIAEDGASLDNGENLFYGCSNLVSVDLRKLNTSTVTTMSSMFSGCPKLETVQLKGINTSKVTDMSYMFDACESLISLDLTGMDTSRVTNMYSMFAQCKALAELNVGSFDTKNVTNMSWMFMNCISLKDLDLSHFNTAKVTDAQCMFTGCKKLKTLDISNFNSKGMKTSNTMPDFLGCNQLKRITVRNDFISDSVPAQSLLRICPGWKDESTGTSYDSVQKLEKLTGTDIVTLVRNRYTVEFDANGGTGDMSKFDGFVTPAIMIPACEFIPPVGVGFYAEYSGIWILEGDWIPGGSKEWPANEGVVLEGDTVIKPKWKTTELAAPNGCTIKGQLAMWNERSYAVKYEFSLYSSADAETPVLTMETTKTMLDLKAIYPALELGTYYRFTVRAFRTDDQYSPSAASSWTYMPYPSLTGQATGIPEEAHAGDVLTVDDPNGVDKSILLYQWERSDDGQNWSVIAGEGSASYTAKKEDEEKYIRVNVMARDYMGKQTSRACLIVAKLSGTMQITGTPRYGSTLTAVITGSQDANFVYNWYRDSVNICSTASNQYTTTLEDIGRTISCTATAYGGVKGSLTASGVEIQKAVGPAAPDITSHPATLEDDSNGWIEIAGGYPIEYSTSPDFASSGIVSSGNLYGLTSGTYYLRTAASSWKEAGAVTSVIVDVHTAALAIKPIDPIPFGTAGRFTDNIIVEAVGGTEPYTWEIITQPYFVDAFSKEGFRADTTLNTFYPGKTASFYVQFPNSRGSNLGRMRIKVTDQNGDIAELPITFEGYKANYAVEYPYYFSIEKAEGREDFSTKTYTYGYDPIPKSEAMIVTLRNECGDEAYPIILSDLTFDVANGNGQINYDVYVDPAFSGDRLGRYEEVDIYIVPKTGLNASTGWVSGYPANLTVTHSEGTRSTLNYGSFFLVEPKALDTCIVEEIPAQSYTGSAITPDLRIWDGKRYLSDEDCYVEWMDNVEEGTASYTVIAKEEFGVGSRNYAGSISGTFLISKEQVGISGALIPHDAGVVLDAVTVEVLQGDTVIKSAVGSTASGYSIMGLADGTYTLRVSADGYATATTSVTVSGSTVVKNITIYTKVKYEHTLSVQNNLAINYYVGQSKITDLTNVRLELSMDKYDDLGIKTVDDSTIAGNLTTNGSVKEYKFIYAGVASYQAINEIRATLVGEKDGVTYSFAPDVYSVETYCYNQIRKSTVAEKTKRLLVDLLNYCAASQTHFGIRTDRLANSRLTAEEKAYGTAEDPVLHNASASTALDGATAKFSGKTLVLGNSVELKIYMKLPGTVKDNIKLRLSYVNMYGVSTTVDIPYAQFAYDAKADEYSAKYTGIIAPEFGNTITLKILDGSKEISSTDLYSIETYAYNRVNNSNSVTLKAVVVAMMKYSNSAKAYFQ
ncbi:MAG: BspA family leucine-rich repeat surface protein [Acetatifactor sp.]|nr:BspA family leucine-rich repeat surface protein [Acetatifactor sp.]